MLIFLKSATDIIIYCLEISDPQENICFNVVRELLHS